MANGLPLVSGQPDYTLRDALLQKCKGSPILTPCTSETVASDLTHEFILNLCQWNEKTEDVGLDECPSTLDLPRIKRFSKWVTKNYLAMGLMVNGVKHYGISRGRDGLYTPLEDPARIPVVDLPEGNSWQEGALVATIWPDGKLIWAVDEISGIFSQNKSASCFVDFSTPGAVGCDSVLAKMKWYGTGHLNHIDFKAK